MIHFEAECVVNIADGIYFRPNESGTYIEIATRFVAEGIILSKDDMIRLRDALNEALPSES